MSIPVTVRRPPATINPQTSWQNVRYDGAVKHGRTAANKVAREVGTVGCGSISGPLARGGEKTADASARSAPDQAAAPQPCKIIYLIAETAKAE
ncbi:hypothetical protein, partial [Geodermatophilus sp. DF01-2]|uniref:hypothetical protein n=1 Tax=Geodermatophilus sp. DF01-2 TaxID=2559610 RepID=UPI001ADDA941